MEERSGEGELEERRGEGEVEERRGGDGEEENSRRREETVGGLEQEAELIEFFY